MIMLLTLTYFPEKMQIGKNKKTRIEFQEL